MSLQGHAFVEFKVKRPGDRNVKCTILLLLDYQPMKFKLHPRLAKLLGMATETRPKIIEALWQYIKTHKLQVCFLHIGYFCFVSSDLFNLEFFCSIASSYRILTNSNVFMDYPVRIAM